MSNLSWNSVTVKCLIKSHWNIEIVWSQIAVVFFLGTHYMRFPLIPLCTRLSSEPPRIDQPQSMKKCKSATQPLENANIFVIITEVHICGVCAICQGSKDSAHPVCNSATQTEVMWNDEMCGMQHWVAMCHSDNEPLSNVQQRGHAHATITATTTANS